MYDQFKVGDSVVVKLRVKDPDIDGDLGRCQGHVTGIKHYKQVDDLTIMITWDRVVMRPEGWTEKRAG